MAKIGTLEVSRVKLADGAVSDFVSGTAGTTSVPASSFTTLISLSVSNPFGFPLVGTFIYPSTIAVNPSWRIRRGSTVLMSGNNTAPLYQWLFDPEPSLGTSTYTLQAHGSGTAGDVGASALHLQWFHK